MFSPFRKGKEMRFSRDEIKADLLDNFAEISGAVYPEDLLRERAEGYAPIYNGEIIKDWAEMDGEYDNSWKDLGGDPSKGIVHLMLIDLVAYLESLTLYVWDEILAEKGLTNE